MKDVCISGVRLGLGGSNLNAKRYWEFLGINTANNSKTDTSTKQKAQKESVETV